MPFSLQEIDRDHLEEMARQYEEEGYVILTDVPDRVISQFKSDIAKTAGLGHGDLEKFFAPDGHDQLLPLETRKRMSRIPTDETLVDVLLEVFGEVVARLMGPLIQVSNDYHAQIKGAPGVEIDYGGFDTEFMAVQSTYLPHQDFTGARGPTSPSFAVLWVSINSCPDWTMRFYPKTHLEGLICDRWFPNDHPLLDTFAGAFDAASEPGTALFFNSLLLHGGTNPGALRRVSCDIRFFPLCGFLPSKVHVLAEKPVATIRDRLASEHSPTLNAPLLEDLVFLGQDLPAEAPKPLSILNWAFYIYHRLLGDTDTALNYFERFVNVDIGIAPPKTYIDKYHNHPILDTSLRSALEAITKAEPGIAELRDMARIIAQAQAGPS